jgi:large subunit ribosomal protein L23
MKSAVYQVIRRPIVTEKGLGVKETQQTVVFEVSPDATKTQIKEAVQQIFKVKVEAVRTALCHGKFRRRGRAEGFRRDWKKAYVKLSEDSKMIEYAENL